MKIALPPVNIHTGGYPLSMHDNLPTNFSKLLDIYLQSLLAKDVELAMRRCFTLSKIVRAPFVIWDL
jgi:hypothetical protein